MALSLCLSFRVARSRPQISALLLLLLAAGSKFFAQSTAGQASTVQIRGTLVNSATGQPVPHVLVTSADNESAVFSDESGRFELTLVRGTAFSVRKPGFKAVSSTSLTIGMFGRVGASSWIEAGTASADLVISMAPEAVLSGRISLSGSDVPDEVAVRLYRQVVQDGRVHWDPTETVTNHEGEFRFAELDAGVYRVGTGGLLDHGAEDPAEAMPKSGYPATYYPGVPEFGSAASLSIAAGDHATADLHLSHQPFYPVGGQIMPVQHNTSWNITILDEENRSLDYPGRVLPEGQAFEANLPDGKYKIAISAFADSSMFGQANVTVSGAAVHGLRISMLPGVNIPVIVRREFTSRRADQPTAVIDSSGAIRQMPISLDLQPVEPGLGIPAGLAPPRPGDDPDRWSLHSVAPGQYWVRAFAEGTGYVASIVSGNINLIDQPLVVGASSQEEPIEVTLRDDVASLKGMVRTDTSTNQRSACIYLIPRSGSAVQLQEATTDQSGNFSFAQVPPGQYLLLASAQPMELAYRDPEAMRSYESVGQLVTLTPGGSADVQVRLVPER